jgi:hypothetical protein
VPASLFGRLRAAVLSLLLIIAFAAPAFAGPFEDAVAKFANDDFSDTAEAIDAIAGYSPIPKARRSSSSTPTTRSSMPRPVRPSTSCLTAPAKYGSTTACAGP